MHFAYADPPTTNKGNACTETTPKPPSGTTNKATSTSSTDYSPTTPTAGRSHATPPTSIGYSQQHPTPESAHGPKPSTKSAPYAPSNTHGNPYSSTAAAKFQNGNQWCATGSPAPDP